MARRRKWTYSEKELLAEKYSTHTIKELQKLFPNRTADMINAQIKRLKKLNKITDTRTDDTLKRSYEQRGS